MRTTVLAAILATFLASCSTGKRIASLTSTDVDTNFHLYLLVGQSNMAGRAKLDSVSKIVDSAIFALDSNGHWVYAVDPIHFDKPVAGVGPGIRFAKAMLAASRDTSVRIGLIPCAVGGTSINLWFKGQYDKVTKTHPYDDAIRRAKLAMKDGVLKGILWHQGGSDNTPQKATGYLDKQLAVIENFRYDLGAELPFVLGEQGYYKDVHVINDIVRDISDRLPKVALVSAEGLTDIGDKLHFDTPSVRELGNRYAEAMKALQQQKSKDE